MQNWIDALANPGLVFTIAEGSAWVVEISGENMVANSFVTAIMVTEDAATLTASAEGFLEATMKFDDAGFLTAEVFNNKVEVTEVTAEVGGEVMQMPTDIDLPGGLGSFITSGAEMTCANDQLIFINSTGTQPPHHARSRELTRSAGSGAPQASEASAIDLIGHEVGRDHLFAQQWGMTRIQAGGAGTTAWVGRRQGSMVSPRQMR